MVDKNEKRDGFFNVFGRRKHKDQATSKKLSKKRSESDAGYRYPCSDLRTAINTKQLDASSLANATTNFPKESTSQFMRDSSFEPASHIYRDYPVTGAVRLSASSSLSHSAKGPMEEYRRDSSGFGQYAAPLYKGGSGRADSEPWIPVNHFVKNGSSSPKTRRNGGKLIKAHPKPVSQDQILDKDTGERKDLTEMMHAFTYNETLDDTSENSSGESFCYDPTRPDGTATLASASPEIWLSIADFLSPLDVVNLSSTCRTLCARLGREPYKLFLNPANRSDRLTFLLAMDHKLPRHLFCFPCAQWHLRIQPGFEALKPRHVLNPLFDCPNRTNIHLPPPRIRIADNRLLPFTFAQLARRAQEFGLDFGVSHASLAKRWKEPESGWMHETTYHINFSSHLLMRVKSQRYVTGGMTAAAKRMLLFNRTDYTPYFSVCAHWKDGVLTSIPRCALDHIPFTAEGDALSFNTVREKAVGRKAAGVVHLCDRCRPMRRCPECPTEYLFELKLAEDKTVQGMSPDRFKQALLVTRWSDLGPARSPSDKEWAAVAGEYEGYDSFLEIGRRAVSGVFEGAVSDTVPGQRILSMNPKKVKADEIGGGWY